MLNRLNARHLFAALVLAALVPMTAAAQSAPTAGGASQSQTTTGIVASSSAGSVVVETEANEMMLFVVDRDTVRPATIARGSRVTIVSRPGDTMSEPRVATRVTIDTRPAGTPAGAAGQEGGAGASVIPPAVRRLERQIERQVQRFGVGVRGGVALDPELIVVGAHARVGPFFSDNVFFRPNVEFAFGEVTALVALNLEAVYRLPAAPRLGGGSPYLGAGPSFTFIDRGFEADEDGREIDFDDFSLDGGLSILAGVEYANGMFLELKGTAYTAPHIRLLIGFTF